jgi:hypothetical protein
MAKTSGGSRSDGMTAVWGVIAVVVVAAFLVWISMASSPSVVATPDEGPAREGPETALLVTAMEFEPNMAGYRGQDIELVDVPIAQLLGRRLLMVELPSGSPFLVMLTDAVVADGPAPEPPARVSITGRVLEKTDAVLDQWQQNGVIESQGHRAMAEYGTEYMEARRVRRAG